MKKKEAAKVILARIADARYDWQVEQGKSGGVSQKKLAKLIQNVDEANTNGSADSYMDAQKQLIDALLVALLAGGVTT